MFSFEKTSVMFSKINKQKKNLDIMKYLFNLTKLVSFILLIIIFFFMPFNCLHTEYIMFLIR